MLNPDGVIVGNHRCSLVGYDLNRQYKGGLKKSQETFMPEIFWTKALLFHAKDQGIRPKMIIDYHAHSRKQNSFFLACRAKKPLHKSKTVHTSMEIKTDDPPEGSEGMSVSTSSIPTVKSSQVSQATTHIGDGPELEIDEEEKREAKPTQSDHILHGQKELTKIFHKISSGFSMDDCSFKVTKKHSKKSGTLRHVGYFDLGVPMTYTLETTYNGCDKPGSNWNGYQLGPSELGKIGEDLMKAIYEMDNGPDKPPVPPTPAQRPNSPI